MEGLSWWETQQITTVVMNERHVVGLGLMHVETWDSVLLMENASVFIRSAVEVSVSDALSTKTTNPALILDFAAVQI